MIETSLSQSDPMSLPERPFGRIARSVSAHSLLTALMIVTPMPVFVPTTLLHCGIRNGRRAAWTALAAAFAIAALYTGVFRSPGALDVVITLLAVAVPALAVLPLVERGANLGRIVAFMLIGSIIGLLAVEMGSREVFSASVFDQQAEQMRQLNSRNMEVYRASGMPSSQLSVVRKAQEYTLFLLPAGTITSVALFFILSLLMLGRLKAWRDLAAQRGDAPAGPLLFRNFALPEWMLFAFIAGGLAPLLGGPLQKAAANVLTVVVFLYIVQGFAILRFIFAAVGVGLLGTVLGMVLIGGLTMPLLGVAGLFDPFFDFRHFKKRKDDSNESHSD